MRKDKVTTELSKLEAEYNELNNMIKSTGIGAIVLDHNLCIQRLTPAAARLFRQAPYAKGRSVRDVEWRFEDASLVDEVRQALGGAGRYEKKIRTHADEYYLRRIQPYYDSKGLISGVVITFYQLDTGEQYHGQVSPSMPPLQTMIDALPILVSYVDHEACYQFNNAAYEEWYGLDRNATKGKHISAILGRTCYRRIAGYVQQALQGKRVSYETEVTRHDAQVRTVHVDYIPHFSSEGQAFGFFALIRDITDQRRNEIARNRLVALVSSSREAIIGKDLDGIVTSWNRGAEKIYGYTASEMVGKPILCLIPKERRREYHLFMAKLRRGEQVEELETIRTKKGGQIIRVSLTLSPIRDASETIIGVSVISRDITKRKQIEENLVRNEAMLRAQAKMLSDMDQRKGAFLGMLAHEFRNPLASIQHALALLHAQELCLDPDQRWAIDLIDRQVERIAYLVSGFTDVSRLTSGEVVLHKKRVDAVDVVRRAVDTLRSTIARRHQQLCLSLPAKPLWIQADPARLEQVVENLLSNASKYTQQGGKISVITYREKESILIKVQDTGAGIGQEELSNIVDLFSRPEYAWHFAGHVLGFGLPAVKNLVNMHSGKVHVTSRAGGGSEFVVRLPLDVNHQLLPERPDKDRVRVVNIPPHRILLVEDNKDVAESFATLLRAKRHTVEVVHDGLAALKVAEVFRPEIVFIDIGLPKMNGYEVARSLRKEHKKGSMVLVAITGYGQHQDVVSAQEAGFDHHMLKPVKLQDIESLLVSHFGNLRNS